MLAEDGHVELRDLLAEVVRLLVGHQSVLAQLGQVGGHDARLFELPDEAGRGTSVQEGPDCGAEHVVSVLAPVPLSLVLGVGGLDGGVGLFSDLDDELLRVGREVLFDGSTQVAVERVSQVVKVDAVHVLVGGLRLTRVKVDLAKLVFQLVQVHVLALSCWRLDLLRLLVVLLFRQLI